MKNEKISFSSLSHNSNLIKLNSLQTSTVKGGSDSFDDTADQGRHRTGGLSGGS